MLTKSQHMDDHTLNRTGLTKREHAILQALRDFAFRALFKGTDEEQGFRVYDAVFNLEVLWRKRRARETGKQTRCTNVAFRD